MRSYNRFDTDQEIECRVDKTKHFVRLYNLSCGGCMIESDSDKIENGAEIKIRLGPKTIIPGRVVWRADKNAGVKFETPLHQKVVQHYGYTPSEEFDRHDPRDRFGLPLSV
uniref:PilZ domain-containing protein n=1 Tax=Parerythrobacter lutipelagi TaxID=1964208 RepID=UPI0010F5046E|nr:PilZ domain-containing protein [Parerythrobacter lutipelagi]